MGQALFAENMGRTLETGNLIDLVAAGQLPHAHFGPDVQQAREYALVRLREDLASDRLQSWAAHRGGAEVLVVASAQVWDSEQLGLGCGRLDWILRTGPSPIVESLIGGLRGEVERWCRERDIALLSCKVATADLPVVHALQAWSMRLVDCEVIWSIDTAAVRPEVEPSGYIIEQVQGQDIDGIGDLGKVFTLDRFHADDRIDDQGADRLWAASLRNACASRADQVIVARAGKRVIGAVTCFIDCDAAYYLSGPVCDFVHVAVDPAWRGRGVGVVMLDRAIAWAGVQTRFAQVGTQVRNYAANGLYRKAGFSLVESQYSLHGHLAPWMKH